MKTITYRELLNLIYDGETPERIIYENNGIEYQRTRNDYVSFDGEYLSNVISTDLLVLEMACDDCITIYDDILDNKEKEYLSNIIKPFRNKITTIERRKNKEWERIVINYKDYDDTENMSSFMSLPMFEVGTMYKGMKLNKRYTLEELGL